VVNFDYSLWRVKTPPQNIISQNIISNNPPLFDSANISKNYYDFRLQLASPAINTGTNTSANIDLDGKPRPSGQPDLGCFEKQ
jgi:hypothetical protein